MQTYWFYGAYSSQLQVYANKVDALIQVADYLKFVDSKTLQDAGFSSRKAMKEAMYRRVKVCGDIT
jgi:hypothetical protein